MLGYRVSMQLKMEHDTKTHGIVQMLGHSALEIFSSLVITWGIQKLTVLMKYL